MPLSFKETKSGQTATSIAASASAPASASASASSVTLIQSPKPKQPQRIRITQPRTDWKIGQQQTYNGVKMTKELGQDRVQGLDLFAWQLKAKAQPLWKALQTANKTVSTQDWKVGSSIEAKGRLGPLHVFSPSV
jgi:hypothetical protein